MEGEFLSLVYENSRDRVKEPRFQRKNERTEMSLALCHFSFEALCCCTSCMFGSQTEMAVKR